MEIQATLNDDFERVKELIETHHLPIMSNHLDTAEVHQFTQELNESERLEISSFHLNHPEVKNLKILSIGLALVNAGIFKENDLPLVCKKLLAHYDPSGFTNRKSMLAPKNGLEIFLNAHKDDLSEEVRAESAEYLFEVLDQIEDSKQSFLVGEANERDLTILLSKVVSPNNQEQTARLEALINKLDQKYVARLDRQQYVGYAGKFLKKEMSDTFPASAEKAFELVGEMILLKPPEANYFVDNLGDIYQYPHAEILLQKALTHPEVARKFLDKLMSDKEPWRDEEWVEDCAIFASTTLFFDHRMVNFKNFDPKVREDAEYRAVLIEKLLDSAVSIREDITSEDIVEILKQKPERIEEIIEGINLYRIISANPELSYSEIEELRQKLDKISPEINLAIINLIFRNEYSSGIKLKQKLTTLGYSLTDLPLIFNKESVVGLITILADYPSKYTFALGTLLTLVKTGDLPPEIIEKIKPQLSEIEMKLLPDNGEWYLCPNAEPYLKRSLDAGACIEVNDWLVVKFYGKLGGLCTKTFTTKEGFTFLEGAWYCPVDENTISAINNAFDEGKGSISLTSGEWAFMRTGADRVQDDTEEGVVFDELMLLTKQKMAELKEHPPELIDGNSRKFYREEKQH